MYQKEIPCTIMRGGTSKAVFFLEKDLPAGEKERDAVILKIVGSPDKRQIDGLGGAVSVTTKAAVIGPPSVPGADVDYLFLQPSITEAFVSSAGNCGNISSAVGPFAIEMGLVKAEDPETVVRVYNRNTKKIIRETVQTPGGRVTYSGSTSIAGVPGTAAPVKLEFPEPAGSMFGRLLPTGKTAEMLEYESGKAVEVSIVDATNPLIFVNAASVGMDGTELPPEIDGNPELLVRLEAIRGAAAVLLGVCKKPEEARHVSPGIPKIAVIGPAKPYETSEGEKIGGDDYDLSIRMMSMQKAHPACAMTGAMCTAAAAVCPGTLVWKACQREEEPVKTTIRLGHAGGLLEAGAKAEPGTDGCPHICSVSGIRTARRLMSGTAFYEPLGE